MKESGGSEIHEGVLDPEICEEREGKRKPSCPSVPLRCCGCRDGRGKKATRNKKKTKTQTREKKKKFRVQLSLLSSRHLIIILRRRYLAAKGDKKARRIPTPIRVNIDESIDGRSQLCLPPPPHTLSRQSVCLSFPAGSWPPRPISAAHTPSAK